MTDHPSQPIDTPLRRVVVRGSRFLHYCHDGSMLTLCGRVAIYRHAYMPRRDDCRRCVIEATSNGKAVPK